MAARVDFYHLGASPVERVLRQICEKVLADRQRLLIVTEDEAAAARLDTYLWDHAPDAFLPHGRAGRGDEADQPILLADAPEPLNGATAVALADGRWREAALAFERVFHFFDDDGIGPAREAWKALGRHEGLERRFWRQEDGRWRQTA